jgi:Cu/Zn superoxide dismutase
MTVSVARPVWRKTGLVVAGAALVGTLGALAPAVAGTANVFRGDVSDLAPAAAGPFDHASAQLVLVGSHGDSTNIVLVVKDVDRSVAGQTFGAHLHTGPCVPGNGAAAGPHYNHSWVVPAVVDRTTEVWLDFTVTRGGTGQSRWQSGWVPTPGQRSVVIHQNPTAPDGTAGARIACLPVEW